MLVHFELLLSNVNLLYDEFLQLDFERYHAMDRWTTSRAP